MLLYVYLSSTVILCIYCSFKAALCHFWTMVRWSWSHIRAEIVSPQIKLGIHSSFRLFHLLLGSLFNAGLMHCSSASPNNPPMLKVLRWIAGHCCCSFKPAELNWCLYERDSWCDRSHHTSHQQDLWWIWKQFSQNQRCDVFVWCKMNERSEIWKLFQQKILLHGCFRMEVYKRTKSLEL